MFWKGTEIDALSALALEPNFAASVVTGGSDYLNIIREVGLLLENIPVSAEHYERSWDLLENRYVNPQLIVSSYLSTLTSLESFKSESAAEITSLHDTTVDCVEALTTLKRPVTYCSDWLVHITVEKFDLQIKDLNEMLVELLPQVIHQISLNLTK